MDWINMNKHELKVTTKKILNNVNIITPSLDSSALEAADRSFFYRNSKIRCTKRASTMGSNHLYNDANAGQNEVSKKKTGMLYDHNCGSWVLSSSLISSPRPSK